VPGSRPAGSKLAWPTACAIEWTSGQLGAWVLRWSCLLSFRQPGSALAQLAGRAKAEAGSEPAAGQMALSYNALPF
jgi:hypothetical protein